MDADPRPLGPMALGTVAFVSGAAVLAAETGLLRVLAPYFGASTYVWINVIGVVLAALAVGYWVGGWLADRAPRSGPFLAVVVGGGAWLAVVPFLVKPLAEALLPAPGAPLQSLGRVLVLGSAASACLLIAPPIALLGTIGPYVTRLLAGRGMAVGRASGLVLAVSTVGSLVGTYVPTLWLIPLIGSRLTVSGSGLVLVATACLAYGGRRGLAGVGAAAAALVCAAAGYAEVPVRDGPGVRVVERESSLQYVRVADVAWPGGTVRLLTLNEGAEDYHSLRIEGRFMVDAYYDWYVPLPALVVPPDPAAPRPLRVAVLGLAGGSHSRALHHFCARAWDLRIDGVEIDPTVAEVAAAHLGLTAAEHPRLTLHVADARPWLQVAPGPYDLIILDAFAQQLYVPFYLATTEFFALVHDRLAEGGCFAFNVYPARPDGELVNALGATLRTVFGDAVWAAPLPNTGNLLVVARRGAGPLPRERLLDVWRLASGGAGHDAGDLQRLARCSLQLQDGLVPAPHAGPVLTDDRAPVEVMTDRDLARLRALALGEAR